MFVEPSTEARRLLRAVPWLVSPRERSLLGDFLRMVVVAPFTQFTFFSFELQVFLFEVFHLTPWAKAGHLLGMVGVNFFLLAGLSTFELGLTTAAAPYAALLLLWYLSVARRARLLGWGLAMIPLVLGLWAGAHAFARSCAPLGLWASPWLWMMASAFVIAASHIPEPMLPPRAVKGPRWRSLPEALNADSRVGVVFNGVRVGLFTLWGTLDELWAAPRLMPYNFLRLLFLAGYAPERWAEIQRWSRRALESGNPALDYVGIGGATYLELSR